MQDPQQLYYEIVSTSLEKIRKALPKKLKPLKETIISFQEQLKSDKQLDANKYFPVYKECLESKDAKLIELTLNHIYKLISNSFLTGNCNDLLPASNGADGQNGELQSSPKMKRKLIDTIIESVCACKGDKKEEVLVLVVRILLTMVTGITCEVHYNSLRETMDTLFSIFTNLKNPENQVIARTAITQITNLTFQRMEEYNAHEHEFRGRRDKANGTTRPPLKLTKIKSFEPALGQNDASIMGAKPLRGLDLDVSRQRLSLPTHQLSLPLSPGGAVNSTFAQVLDQMNMDYVDIGSPTMKDGPMEKYIGSCLRNLVDDVCINAQKKIELQEDLKDDPENEDIKFELEHIPLRSVPPSTIDPNDGNYRMLRAVDLDNERGSPAGLFGWCFVCRLSANLYCKDTRIPVCSVECKLKHSDDLENVNKPPKPIEVLATTIHIDDALTLFEYLCRMSGKDTASELPAPALRNKTVSLELIASIMTNPGPIFLSSKNFRNVVKDSLCGSILINSISSDKSIFAYSIEIITSLVTYFKETLKAEVGVFFQNILIHMLESNNSSYNHRSLALQVLHKLTSGPKMMLEFYVNYDCSINSINLVEQIVEILCRVAKGKFSRPEYNSFILPPQENYLKTVALESLVIMAKSLMHFTQDFQKNLKKRVEETPNNKAALTSSLKDERDFDDNDSSDGEDNRGSGDVSVFEKEGEIENQRKLKKELQKAIEKFNNKFKVGIKYLAQLGFINLEDPKTVGRFFMNTPGLSKEMLGEYFGDENEFNIKVLTEWMDLMDFTGLTLDDGLRKLLQKFILPGEGQKIDRIVQVFAGKHFKDNPTHFNSANAAYTLSYLLIMLQTDAHNPHIKEKERMKLASFISLARGINDGENLPEEELVGYYNRILETPLGIHTKGEAKEAAESVGLNVKRKEERFRKETKKMLERGQDIIKQKQDELYYKVKNTDSIKPLFQEILWSPVLSVFSELLEKSEDPKIIALCVEGFKSCIILTGLHSMDTERDTFVSSLAKFTNLTALREIKEKNAQCLKAIIYLASKHGNLLRKSWLFVLECISKIDYYLNRLQNAGKETDARNDITDQIELNKSEIIRGIVDVHTINCIFSRSSSFELEEIMDFIMCICKTSDEELKNPQLQGTYSLQKLVEVAHFNLDRIKFIWSQIWNVTREYISNVAIHSAPEIAFFAVDSLKQLSLKFLIKEELSNLEFQKEFLRPFGTIFQRVENNDIKELVLTCCSYIISHVGDKLKSGWKTILDILGLGAESDKKNIIHYSFSISENIMNESLDSLKELLSEFIILLIKFSKCKSEEIAVKALEYLKKMIIRMIQDAGSKPLFDADNDTILEKSQSAEQEEGSKEVTTEEAGEGDDVPPSALSEGNWITLLTSLFTLCSDSKKKIRREGTTILFEILKSYGKEFSQDFWQVVLSGVIKPLFDEIQFYFQSKNEEELLSYNDSCREIFSNMIDVYYIYYDKLSCFTEDFLKILMHCIDNPKGNLAKISINALKQLITQCHMKFSENEWSMMVNICSEIVENTTPYQLLEYQAGKHSARGDRPNKKSVSISSEECLTQCIVQLLMIALIKDVADTYDQYLSDEQLKRILETLNASYQFAKNFNDQIYLRYCLWKNGLMREMDQLPGLLKQGKEALGAYILILHKLYERNYLRTDADPSIRKQYLEEFLTLGVNLMKTISVKSDEYITRIKERALKPEYLGVESPLRISDEIFSFEDQSLKESFMRQSDKLTVIELEKEIMHSRTILSVVFLPKLEFIDVTEVKERMKELVGQLVDVSFYCTPKPLAIGETSSQVGKVYAVNDESLILIRVILNKYFEYNFSKMKSE